MTSIPDPDVTLNQVAQIVSTDWIVPPVSIEIDPRWREAFVASRIADVLAQLAADQRLYGLDRADRAWLHGKAEQLVIEALDYFGRAPAQVVPFPTRDVQAAG